MPLCKRVIAELGEEASAQQVYQAATIWERSVSATRRRARAQLAECTVPLSERLLLRGNLEVVPQGVYPRARANTR